MNISSGLIIGDVNLFISHVANGRRPFVPWNDHRLNNL